MFIIELTYQGAIAQIDALLPAHRNWLTDNYRQGHFIASGRKIPRTGGVILCKTLDRMDLDNILVQDPLYYLVKYTVIEFAPSMTNPFFELLKEV